jgi:hypothetical protein
MPEGMEQNLHAQAKPRVQVVTWKEAGEYISLARQPNNVV